MANRRNPLETSVVKAIQKFLDKTSGCYQFKTEGGRYGRKGLPDLVGCCNGKFFAFEVKRPSRKNEENGGASKLQMYELGKVKKAGGIAEVVYCLEDVKEALKNAL